MPKGSAKPITNIRKFVADTFNLKFYQAGSKQRPPKTKRIAKKVLREYVDYGWKSHRWFLYSHNKCGAWFGKWYPRGPYCA